MMVSGRVRRSSPRWAKSARGSLSLALVLSVIVSLVLPAPASVSAAVLPASHVTMLSEEDITTTFPSDARSSGSNRIDTAVAISRDTDQPYDAVVIATSVNFPDALAGTPLADAANAPILLTHPGALDASVKARLLELKASGAQTAYLIGSTSALSPAIEVAVGSVFGAGKTKRIGGANRYETAALVATELATLRPVTGIVLASGETYPDALSAAGWAAFSGQAILLTRQNSLPAATAASLARFGHTPASGDETGTAENELLVVGGVAAISDAVIAPYPGVTRIGGANRYETSALIAQHAWEWGMPSESVGLATGLNFPDALAAGPWCAANGAPLLLVSASTLPPAAGAYLAGHASTIKHLQVFGGTASVAGPVVTAAAEAAKVMMSKKAPIASAATDALLSDVTSDTLVFSDQNAQLDELDIGWVIRSNPTSAAPNGYFRKIIAVDHLPDGSVSYETTSAAITDVLLKGSVDMVMPCGEVPTDTPDAATASGSMHPAAIEAEKSFGAAVKFAFTPSVTFDGADGEKFTFGGKGSLDFKQSVVVSIVIDGRWKSGLFGIPYWDTYVSQYEQYMSYKGSFKLSYSASGKIDFIDLPIGPQIPVAVDPIITGFLVKPEVQLKLKGSVGLEVAVTSSFTIAQTKTGIRFRDGHGWKSFEERPKSSTQPEYSAQHDGSGSLEIGIGAEVAISICDFVGPYIDVTLLSGKATLTVTPATKSVEVKVSIGTSVGGGIKTDIPILGANLAKVKIFKVDFTYFEWSWKIALVDPPPPPPPPATGPVVRVSTSSSGEQGDAWSAGSAISSDGRYVAFCSAASNLVAGDTNASSDVFVRDASNGVVVRISTDSSGVQVEGRSEDLPSISADGRYVAFVSTAPNLVPGDTNGTKDVFVKDTVSGSTVLVSSDSAGRQVYEYGGAYRCSISSTGRYVAFVTGSGDVYVKDMTDGTTTCATTASAGIQPFHGALGGVSISSDGRYVVFDSNSYMLVPDDVPNEECFMKDTVTGETTRVSADEYGHPGIYESRRPSITPDGRYVVFDSNSPNLVIGDSGVDWDVFVKEVATGAIERVSTSSSGGQGDALAGYASISADGSTVVFMSHSTNLVADDTNAFGDVFAKDRATGSTTRVSADAAGAQGNSWSGGPSISANGRYVAFESYSTNLVSDDTNACSDVFVKDMLWPATTSTQQMPRSDALHSRAKSPW